MQGKTILSSVTVALAIMAAPVRADSGYFVTASIGDSSAELDGFLLPALADDDTSFGIGAGWKFNAYFSVQAGYHDFGELSARTCPPGTFCLEPPECPPTGCILESQVDVDLTGWSLRATGAYPLGERFSAFASLGVLVWDAESTFSTPGVDLSLPPIPVEGDDYLYEAGLRFHLTEQWSLEASYEKAELDIESSKLGVTFRF